MYNCFLFLQLPPQNVESIYNHSATTRLITSCSLPGTFEIRMYINTHANIACCVERYSCAAHTTIVFFGFSAFALVHTRKPLLPRLVVCICSSFCFMLFVTVRRYIPCIPSVLKLFLWL